MFDGIGRRDLSIPRKFQAINLLSKRALVGKSALDVCVCATGQRFGSFLVDEDTRYAVSLLTILIDRNRYYLNEAVCSLHRS